MTAVDVIKYENIYKFSMNETQCVDIFTENDYE